MYKPEELRHEAKNVVKKFATGAAGTAAATGPIPGTSVALTGIEIAMIQAIARVYDFNLNLQEAGIAAGGLIATSSGLKHLAIELSTSIPGLGWWLIKPAIAGGFCKCLGELAINHFEEKYQDKWEGI